MEQAAIRIVYMGTPEFAVEPLKALVQGGFRVVAVVTMPDKPAGRGMKMQASPVKNFALEHSIPVLQPEKLKDPAFLMDLRAYQADLQIVVAFRMLPEVVWNMPPMGTFNLHASLLPAYRGAAPIHWAVINGERRTGATTFFLQHEIDTGDVLLQRSIEIAPQESTGEVHDRLMQLGADLVVETVTGLIQGSLKPTPQRELHDGVVTFAPKLFRENTRIDWQKPVSAIFNFVRGLCPYPAAWTEWHVADGKVLFVKILEVEVVEAVCTQSIGCIQTDGKRFFRIACADGWVYLKRIQVPGKKVMSIEDYLRGNSPDTNGLFC